MNNNLAKINKQNIATLFYKFLIKIKPLDKNKVFYIYDIDNTIAKTANFKNFDGKLNKENVSDLDYYKKITSKVILNYNNNDIVYFFSVRPINLWIKTYHWIKNIGIELNYTELFFFHSPLHKVKFVEYLCKKGYTINFYDDMSYNHENDEVLYYQKEIEILRKLPITYFDNKFLIKFNK